MRCLNRFSKTLRFSSLFVIVSLMYAQEGRAMDDDWWTAYGEDLGLFDEEQSKDSSSGDNTKEANTPEEGGGQKRKRDPEDERTAKCPRTHEEGDVSSQRVHKTEDAEKTSSNNSSSFNVGSALMDPEPLDLLQNNSSSATSIAQGSYQDTPQDKLANTETLLTLGDKCSEERDYKKARKYYEAAASQGCVKAYVKAAKACLDQYCAEEDYDNGDDIEAAKHYLFAAFDHFEQAASKNHVFSDEESETLRIMMSELERSSPQDIDFKKVAKLCKLAGHDPVINILLGTLYLSGKGVEQDENKAHHYFIKASLNDNGQVSNKELGKIFSEIGFDFLNNRKERNLDYTSLYITPLTPNLQNAIKYFKKAAELDNFESSCELVELFLSDRATPLDLKEALPRLQKKADKGSATACYLLGQFYGDTTKSFYDYKRSEQYFKRGAKLGGLQCMWHYVDDKNLFTAFKYALKILNCFPFTNNDLRDGNIIKSKIAGMNFINSSRAFPDTLDSKGHYNLGKMFSYVHLYPQLDGAARDRRVYVVDETVQEAYTLGKEFLLRAAESKEGKVQLGKAFYKLARLIGAGQRPGDLDKGIEYAEKALENGIEKTLPLCAKLYNLQGKNQMAAAYFFESYRKKFSTLKDLTPYFIFEASTDSGNSSSHVREYIDPNDIFQGKLHSLIRDCEEKYQIYTPDLFLTHSFSGEVSRQNENEGTAELGPLYKALKDYGDDIEESGRDLIAAESSSSQVGLMIPNVKPTAFMRGVYVKDGESAQKGFKVVTVNDQELSCLGDKNPGKGNTFEALITTKAEEAKQTAEKIKSIYRRVLNLPDLKNERRMQLIKEKNDFLAIDEAIEYGPKRLVHLAVTRAPLRAKAFQDEFKELFEGPKD